MSVDGIQGPKKWKIKREDGSRLEPANLSVLRQWVSSHQVGPNDLIINDELADWLPASEVTELADLFQEDFFTSHAYPRKAKAEFSAEDDAIEVPDCAFHPGLTATDICVGCGKFICEECRKRHEGKVYCRRCLAEEKVKAESGMSVGVGSAAPEITSVPSEPVLSRLAIASLVFAIIALLSSITIFVPRFHIMTAPAAGFIAFTSILLAWLALNRMRLSGGVLQGKGLALGGLAIGSVVLIGSLTLIIIFTATRRPVRRGAGDLAEIAPGREQPVSGLIGASSAAREETARQLLEQAEKSLAEGDLKQAADICGTILGSYPNTDTARLVEERLPLIEEALSRQEAEAEAIKAQNEAAASSRFQSAMDMYSEGNASTALELLKSVVARYPDTEAAGKAEVEISKLEQEVLDGELKRRDEEAAKLAAEADRYMESEQFDAAAKLYRRIIGEYPRTPTASDIESKAEQSELLAKDPSEREYRQIMMEIEKSTYEQAIELLQGFILKYPTSGRIDEAKQVLEENRIDKNVADSLYNFGRVQFEEGKYSVAYGRYGKLLGDYPRSRWIPKAKAEYEELIRRLEE